MSRATRPLTWLILIAAALLPIVLLSVYAFGVAGDAVKTLARSTLVAAAQRTADRMDQDFAGAFQTLRDFAHHPQTIAAIATGDPDAVLVQLQAISRADPRLDQTVLVGLDGTLRASFPAASALPEDPSRRQEWLRLATNAAPGAYEGTIGPPPDYAAFATLRYPVRSDDGTLLGTLVSHFRPDLKSAWLATARPTRTGGVVITAPSGASAPQRADPGTPGAAGQPDLLPIAVLSPAIAHEFNDPSGGGEFLGAHQPAAHGWEVHAWQPRAAAYAPVRQLAVRIGFASAILSLAAIALVVVLEGSRRNNDQLNQQLKEHIEDLRRSEESLDRERFLLGTLMEHIPDHIYFKDRESRFIRINPAMARVFKLNSPEEAVDKSDQDFFTAEHAQAALVDEREILRSGQPMVNREEKETWPDGSVTWVSTTKQCLRDRLNNVIGTFGISRDITDRKRAEEALAAKARELARSNEDLEQFAYAASHDLQEPLRMIASYTQLLARRYKDQLDRDAHEFINFAVDGATRMQVLINDLLTYSRVGTRGKPFEEIQGAEIMRRVQLNLQIAIEESAASISCDPLPAIRCDVTQITQLFQNLLSNAIKFRGDAAPVIRISAEEGRPIEAGASPEETEWRFTIRDNGIGIDPEHFERIFLIFQRLHTRAQYPGTGIGLAVCKKIVERHGGRIRVESTPGQGTAFHFSIPKAGEESVP